ncbi:MAG: DoxX family protein [Bacteroidia bacterium]
MKQSKGLNIGLWIAQGLLALAFIMAGLMKITSPIEDLAANGMSFVTEYSEGMVRFIGISEVLGALGLLLPSLLRIKPILTPIAAIGLATVMVLAAIYHITHNEPPVPNVILFALAAFVAWGRLKAAPIQAK